MERLELKVGSSTTLRFKSLASAGYIWDFSIDQPNIISITSAGLTRPTNTPPGHSHDEVFEIAGVRQGVAKVTFIQRRSWQKDNPHTTHTYEFKVEG